MTDPNSVAAAPELVCPLLNGMKIPEVSVRSADGSMFEIAKAVEQNLRFLFFIAADGDRTAKSSWSNCAN